MTHLKKTMNGTEIALVGVLVSLIIWALLICSGILSSYGDFGIYPRGLYQNTSVSRHRTPDVKRCITVAMCFKNEQHILREWLLHYRNEGVTDFILCDDRSDDKSLDVVSIFFSEFNDARLFLWASDTGTGAIQHKFQQYLTLACSRGWITTPWILLVDADEFAYVNASENETLNTYLSDVAHDYITIPWKIFGSSGYVQNPQSVVKDLTYRLNYDDLDNCHWFAKDNRHHDYSRSTPGKYVVRPEAVKALSTHSCELHHSARVLTGASKLSEQALQTFPIVINHYMYQSEQFWRVKMTRGDACNYNVGKYARRWDTFIQGNKRANAVRDETLASSSARAR